MQLNIAVILLIGFYKTYGQQQQDKLVYVQAIWRHGDRAPNKLPYLKDLNTEASWPRGWSQLTNIGMQQLYGLGQFFRTKYGDFIDSRFNLNQVMLTSTNSERAIVSAQAFLYGLFPAKDSDVWMEGENWQPLPFYSRTFGDDDAMLRPTEWDCKLYSEVYKEQNKELFNELKKKYADFFVALQNFTGFPKVTLKTAASLNNIQREILHGMPQPDWVYQRWEAYDNRTTIEIIMELKRIMRVSEFNSPEKARLRGGLLLSDWLERARNVSNQVAIKPTKMNLYSTHDGTVSSLMYALGIADNTLIPYAACLIMEVYRNAETKNTTVKFLYRNQTDTNETYTLIVPGCIEYCPVEDLTELLAPTVISNVTELNEACCEGVVSKKCNLRQLNNAANEQRNFYGSIVSIILLSVFSNYKWRI